MITVDSEMLIMALDDHSLETSWFLDRSTGEVVPCSDMMDIDPDDEIYAALEDDPFRFKRVEPLPSRRGFDVMASFAEEVATGRAQSRLVSALEGRKPFRAFKDALFDTPELREAWFSYSQAKYLELAQEWLDDNDIEAVLVTRIRSTSESEQ
jgi:hypothetical protein